MVSCEKILEAARREQAAMIGLSGLITPSLDEMVHVASEMQRQEFGLPLLIGGATTSPAHTAVKIEPQYEGPVIYVKDASRSVGVAQALIEPTTRDALVEKTRRDNARRREQHAGKKRLAPQLSIEEARRRRHTIDWQSYVPPQPAFTGQRVFDEVRPGGPARLHRLDAFFQRLGISRQVPGNSEGSDRRRGRECAARRCPSHAR